MGCYLEGLYKLEGILYLSSVNYNGIPEDYDYTKIEYIKRCIIQYKFDKTIIFEYDRYWIIVDDLYHLCDLKRLAGKFFI